MFYLTDMGFVADSIVNNYPPKYKGAVMQAYVGGMPAFSQLALYVP